MTLLGIPNTEYQVRSGVRYVTDGDGFVTPLNGADQADLQAAGCITIGTLSATGTGGPIGAPVYIGGTRLS
jgi:hypothetical protein